MAAKHIKKTAMNLEKEAAWKRQTKREGERGSRGSKLVYFLFHVGILNGIFLISFFYLHVSLDFVG